MGRTLPSLSYPGEPRGTSVSLLRKWRYLLTSRNGPLLFCPLLVNSEDEDLVSNSPRYREVC